MKKSIFYYLFAVVCTVCLFTACSDDDDDDNTSTLTVDNIVGTYNGTLQIKTLNLSVQAPVKVIKVSDSKITVGVTGLTIMEIPVDPINVECSIKKDAKDNEFDIAGSGKAKITGLGEFPVTITGDADSKELDIDIVVTKIPALNTLTIEFDGTK